MRKLMSRISEKYQREWKKARLRQCSSGDAEEKRLEQRNTGLFIVFYSGATPKTIVKYPSIYTRILCTYYTSIM